MLNIIIEASEKFNNRRWASLFSLLLFFSVEAIDDVKILDCDKWFAEFRKRK